MTTDTKQPRVFEPRKSLARSDWRYVDLRRAVLAGVGMAASDVANARLTYADMTGIHAPSLDAMHADRESGA